MKFFGREMERHASAHPPGYYGLRVAGFNVEIEPILPETPDAYWEGVIWISGGDQKLLPEIQAQTPEDVGRLMEESVTTYLERLLDLANVDQLMSFDEGEAKAIREGVREGLAPLQELADIFRRVSEKLDSSRREAEKVGP